MRIETHISGKDTGLPSARRPARKPLLTPATWAELHDDLTLALDALGNGPQDVDEDFLCNLVMHQCAALRLTHAVKERMDKDRRAQKAASSRAVL